MTAPLVMGIFVGGRGRRMGGVQKGLLIAPDTGETLVARLLRLGREAGHEVVLLGAAELGADAAGALQLADAAPGVGPLAGLQSLLGYAGSRDALCLACDMPFVSADLLARLAGQQSVSHAGESGLGLGLGLKGAHAIVAREAKRSAEPQAARDAEGSAEPQLARDAKRSAEPQVAPDSEGSADVTGSAGEAHVIAPRDHASGKWEPMFARYRSATVAPLLMQALAEGERSFQGLFTRLTVRELWLDAAERAQLRDWDTPEDMRTRP
jgi:molybdopterin-guanine dinucleotide biosynthesis protein A